MNKLNILWTTDNKDTIFNMISMYSINSKRNGWWDDVNVIIWGASAKLAGSDTQVQTEIMAMISHGVHVEACKACADNFGVAEVLEKLGVEVRYTGEALTKYIRSEEKLITI